jgi:hypothetical protein
MCLAFSEIGSSCGTMVVQDAEPSACLSSWGSHAAVTISALVPHLTPERLVHLAPAPTLLHACWPACMHSISTHRLGLGSHRDEAQPPQLARRAAPGGGRGQGGLGGGSTHSKHDGRGSGWNRRRTRCSLWTSSYPTPNRRCLHHQEAALQLPCVSALPLDCLALVWPTMPLVPRLPCSTLH